MQRVVAVLGALLPIGATAREPSQLSLDEGIRQALSRNSRLAVSRNAVAAARHAARAADAPTSPEIVISPALTSDGSDEELLVAQPLEVNGARRARASAAHAQLRASDARLDLERLEVATEVRKAYHALARSRELLDVALAVAEVARDLDRRVGRMIDEGSRPGIDRTHTAIELARAEAEADRARAVADVAQASLNTLMGRLPQEAIGDIEPLETLAGASNERQPEAAATSRPEILMAVAEHAAAVQEARAARAESIPDIAVQFRAGRIQGGITETGFGVGITLPFLDWGARAHRARQTVAAARARQEEVRWVRARVEDELYEAETLARVAAATVARFRGGILSSADRLLQAAKVGFAEGKADILTVLEAQRTYRSVQTDYIHALSACADASAAVLRARGTMPPDPNRDGEGPTQKKGAAR